MQLNRQNIIDLLERNDHAVERALLVVFRNQTFDEQQKHDVRYRNDVGFTASDAHYGCLHAKQLLKTGHLQEWQIRYWRKKKIEKYWRQLVVAAKEKQKNA